MTSIQLLQEKISDLENKNEILSSGLADSCNRLNESQKLSKIGSWNWNVQTGAIFWSQMMFEILGIKPNSVNPDYQLALKYVHDDDKIRYEASIKEAIDNKYDYYFENRIKLDNNVILSVISRGKCICNDMGELERMIGTVQDITLSKEIKDRNTKLDQFSTLLSHNIKAPVKTIIGYVNLLKSKIYRNSSEKEKLYIDSIEASALELDDKISNLLSQTKSNAN